MNADFAKRFWTAAALVSTAGPAWGCGDFGSYLLDEATHGRGSTPKPPRPPKQPEPCEPEVEEPVDVSPSLFGELLGLSRDAVDDKVRTAVHRYFGIGTDEPNLLIADEGYRVYYELPQDPSMAFIWAPDSDDVRSEGLSYGMMIAVQADLREHFDRLWKFSQTFSQYPADSELEAWRHYFRWQGRVDASNPDEWVVNYGPTTVPAPDGEEYFAAALYLAHRRWGSDGSVDYLTEARTLTSAMLHNPSTEDNRHPVIRPDQNMVVFVPVGGANDFSDPSYHLPAFYELFALDGPSEDAERWRSIAETSRDYLVTSAHPFTGLHPDYASFEGVPVAGGGSMDHDQFRYDAWRVPMNMAVDFDWFSGDARMQTQIERYHAFFSNHLDPENVSSALFFIDGTNPSGGGSTALTATLAAGSLASENALRTRYVENLWGVYQQSGLYRYYQQGVYLLGLLNVAGQFRMEW